MDQLPNLPRTIRKREAKITPIILDWFRKNHDGSCAIEVKQTNGNSIPASALLPHQRAALIAASGTGIVHKLSDEARRRQPFDAFMLCDADAYVVVAFLKYKYALVYPIDAWGIHGARYDDEGVMRIPLGGRKNP